ncbi:hypothetical protein [Methanohalophilus sp.]
MTEIEESDRFECKVVNIINNLKWKGVMVKEIKSGGNVYFARTDPTKDLKPGDTLYLGVKELPSQMEEMQAEVTLYGKNDEKIDWTFI